MSTIPKQIRGTAAAGEQKSDRREISFGRITQLACEYEIVAPIVCGLPASWCHMVERHRCFGELLTAVCADGTMLLEKPSPRFGVGDAFRRMRGEWKRRMCCPFRGLLSAWWPARGLACRIGTRVCQVRGSVASEG